MTSGIKIIVLAAGRGRRMQSEKPKVLSEIQGKSMLEHLRDSIGEIEDEKPIAIVGHKAELIKSKFGDKFVYVTQSDQLGTGHAVAQAENACRGAENIVVLNGDQPFIKANTIRNIIKKHLESGATITFATTRVPNFEDSFKAFSNFARILRVDDKITAIREYKDMKKGEESIKEFNAGCYVFKASWLWENLKKLDKNNAQAEYYLTDLIPLAIKSNEKIENVEIDPQEAMGVNSKEELELLENFEV